MSKLGVALVCLALGLGSSVVGCGDDDGGTSGTSGSGGSGGTGGSGGSGGDNDAGGGTGGTSGTSGTGGSGGSGGTGGDAGEGDACQRGWMKVAACAGADAGFDVGDLDAGLGQCTGAVLCFAECQLESTCQELTSNGAEYQACVLACVTPPAP